MKNYSIIFALFLMLAITTTAFAQQCGEANPAWKACAQDSDCTPANNACGFPDAYNAQSLDTVQKYNACIAPAISCPMMEGTPTSSTAAQCHAGTCRLTPPDTTTTKEK